MRKTINAFFFILMMSAALLLPASGRAAALSSIEQPASQPAQQPVQQSATVMDAITARPEVTFYAELLRRTGLDAVLRGPGPYTVFAPLDAALDTALVAAGLDRTALFADAGLMRQVANAHILTIRATDADLQAQRLPATLATRGGDALVIDSVNGAIRCNGGRIIAADIVTTNGVLHLIDATTLDPAALVPATLVSAAVATDPGDDTASAAAYLRTGHFVGDLGAVDLLLDGPAGRRSLRGLTYTTQQGYEPLSPGVYTLAFVSAGSDQTIPGLGPFQVPLNAGDVLTVLALGSQGRGTLSVQVFAEDYATLAPGQVRVTFFNAIEGAPALEIRGADGLPLFGGLAYNGDPVFLDLPPGNSTFFAGQAGGPAVMQATIPLQADSAPLVVATGTWATGSVQLSAGPAMAIPGSDAQTIRDLLADQAATGGESFAILLTALESAGLLPALANPGPITLFAPTDAAFAAVPGLLSDPALNDILLHHIVNNLVAPGADPGMLTVTTGAGGALSLTVDAAGNLTLDDGVRVLLPPLRASNGVIYVIDGVLRP